MRAPGATWCRCASCPSTRAAGSSGCAASSSWCHAWPRAADVDLVHSLASTAPLRGRARRVTTIHDLNYKLVPDAHFGAARARACACWCRPPRGARTGSSSTPSSTRRISRSHLGTPLGKVDVVPLASRRAGRSTPAPASELRARLALGDGPRAADSVGEAPAQEPAPPARGRRACSEDRPALVLPGYPTPHEAELRERAARARLRRGASRPGSRPRTSKGSTRSPTRSSSRRWPRASACRCWRRWRAACRWPAATARRCRRSRATPRCCSTRGPARDRRRDRAPAGRRPRPSGCAPPDGRAPRPSRGSARRELTAASYARARWPRSSRRRASSEASSERLRGVARRTTSAVERAAPRPPS